jgi:hypothetical protein
MQRLGYAPISKRKNDQLCSRRVRTSAKQKRRVTVRTNGKRQIQKKDLMARFKRKLVSSY